MTDLPKDRLIDIAREAGALGQSIRRKGLEIQTKPGGTPVTNADLAVDEFLKLRLSGLAPELGWLSEETADAPQRLAKRRLFVVDPIDGTRAFMKDKPAWSVCIAVVDAHQPVQAVVFAPDMDQTFYAALGAGAYLNDQVIRASGRQSLVDMKMLGDKPMFDHPAWPLKWPDMQIETRNSIAYRMCLVSSGEFDAAIALNTKSEWDLAASDLIAREAGACSSDHMGDGFSYNQPVPLLRSVVCSAPGVHAEILDRCAHLHHLDGRRTAKSKS